MKNVKKMIQAGLKKFTVITILGVFLMTSLIPVYFSFQNKPYLQ